MHAVPFPTLQMRLFLDVFKKGITWCIIPRYISVSHIVGKNSSNNFVYNVLLPALTTLKLDSIIQTIFFVSFTQDCSSGKRPQGLLFVTCAFFTHAQLALSFYYILCCSVTTSLSLSLTFFFYLMCITMYVIFENILRKENKKS